jgi:hypothetical protein
MTQQASKPIKEFRAGNVRAAVWRNELEQGGRTVVRHSVRVEKRFRNEKGEWQTTPYYFPEELPRLQLVAAKALEFVALRERRKRCRADLDGLDRHPGLTN